jgi:hypothetical protein
MRYRIAKAVLGDLRYVRPMKDKWVDNNDYFGPDRRDGRGGRLRNRRQADDTIEPPSLASTLRRLRVLLGNPVRETAHQRALHLLAAGIDLATRTGKHECLLALQRADQMLRDRPDDFDAAEAAVAEAMAYV